MARRRKRLGEILVNWNVVTPTALGDALAYSQQHGKKIGEALIELELATEEDVTKALATQFDLAYVDLDKNVGVSGALDLIPEKLIKKLKVLPLGREDGKIKVIIHDPLDLDTLDQLRVLLNSQVECAIAPRSKIVRFIDTFLTGMRDSVDEAIEAIDRDKDLLAKEDKRLAAAAEDEDSEAPIIKLLNLMIAEAVRMRASDIHVEPMADRVRVRYRVDGVCIVKDNIPKHMQASVLARLKIMSGLDIAERRLPQDGRIKMRIGSGQIDFRVSSCPAYHGESVVLRILRPDSVKIGIQAMGFEEDDYERFNKIIRQPNGIFLVTGPTGSGKTTTLYGALQELNRPDRKIITAEDPVEYNFSGINQCQVREEIGLTFARILRAMLRQAPNIILVGEIRDREVGDVAIQAALTGHLVFSTLHTNDAPSAITRLIDMGIKPFLVASSIQAIMAQRLMRLICNECKVVDPSPDRFTLRLLGITDKDLEGRTIYKGAGCNRCGGIGYRGRQGIFEMLEMTPELRELAFQRAPANRLRAAARAGGMRTLLDDGKRKILRGVTTPEEIARITQIEGILTEE
ncbi:MAG: Flp pilus assembly complex ATPase component TadA [Planctomycetia bacterium]|nr:MAG: Flp pilus assembly complex ATPase component TadA [Planctomycetia bacterium]